MGSNVQPETRHRHERIEKGSIHMVCKYCGETEELIKCYLLDDFFREIVEVFYICENCRDKYDAKYRARRLFG